LFHSILTSELDGCVRNQFHASAALFEGKESSAHIGWEAGWAPERG
jgi:hypothetical protein